MATNTKFGKINAERTAVAEYAKTYIATETETIYNPTKAQYNAVGFLELHTNYPSEPAPSGQHWETDLWTVTATDATQTWKAVDDVVLLNTYVMADIFFWLRIYDEAHPTAPKGQAVCDWLNANNLYTIAITTQKVTDDNPLFMPTVNAVKEAVGFTDADIAEMLDYAKEV